MRNCLVGLENISENILKQREMRKMSRKDFAEYIEMDYQNYRKMENGKYTTGLSKLICICNILNITPNDLLVKEVESKELFLNLEVDEYQKVKSEKAELQKELEHMSNEVMSPKQYEKMKPVRMSYLEKCREEERLAKKIADLLVRELAG